jgi:hypothetical protein
MVPKTCHPPDQNCHCQYLTLILLSKIKWTIIAGANLRPRRINGS